MMSRKILIGLALALLAAPLLAPAPAHAFSQVMCAPEIAGANNGPRRVVNTSSTAATQPAYQLNGQGCAVIAQADVGFFQSQGYTFGPPFGTILFVTGVLTGTTAVQMPSLPAGAYIREIFVDNSTANAVTGGIDIGITSGGAEVVSALTCAANCLTFVADSALLKRVFSKTAQQALYVVGHTSGNSANLNITVTYGYF